jgi:tetratricopeptide (TPR) repeat protein
MIRKVVFQSAGPKFFLFPMSSETELLDDKSDGRPNRRIVIALLLFLIGLVGHTFSASFVVPFHFDDDRNISDHPAVQSFAENGNVEGILRSNRPLGALTLAVNYRLHGAEVWWYHLVNFCLHIVAVLVVFWLAYWCLERCQWPERVDATGRLMIAWVLALLWGVHPLASQPVIYIVQRFEVMAAVFTLLSLLAFSLAAQGKRGALPLLGVSAWLGVFSKEPAAMLPLLLLLWDRTFCADLWQQRPRWRHPVAHLLAWSPALWFLPSVSRWLIPAAASASAVKVNPSSMGFNMPNMSGWDYVCTQPEVILHYLRLSLWPQALCFDYGWELQTDPWVYIPLGLAILAVLALGCWLVWRRRVAGFLIVAFFVYLAPTSSFVPILDIAVEHRMYLPLLCVISGGVLLVVRCCFATHRVEALLPSSARVAVLMLVLVIAVAGSMWRTHQRCLLYQDPVALWKETVAIRPNNSRALHNAGSSLLTQRKPEAALPFLTAATDRLAIHSKWWVNLAECQRQLAMFDEAMVSASRALYLSPELGTAYSVRGMLHELGGSFELACVDYQLASERGVHEATYNLASLQLRRGDYRSAANRFERLIAEVPAMEQPPRRLAWILSTASDDSLRDGRRAVELMQRIYRIDTRINPYGWDAYAAALAEVGEFAQAIKAGEKAFELAHQAKQETLALRIRTRLAGYQQQQPYRDDGSDQDSTPIHSDAHIDATPNTRKGN